MTGRFSGCLGTGVFSTVEITTSPAASTPVTLRQTAVTMYLILVSDSATCPDALPVGGYCYVADMYYF